MHRSNPRQPRHSLGILALCSLPLLTQAASTAPTVKSLVEQSEHIVVGKVLSTELLSSAFGNQIQECGIKATVVVIDDLTGNAPEILSVGFYTAPVTGSSYFLPLMKREGPPPSHVIQAPRPTEEYRALANCWSALPTLRADRNTLGELITVTTQQPGRLASSEWVAALWTTYSRKALAADTLVYDFPGTEKQPAVGWMPRARLTPRVMLYGARYVSWPQYRALFAQEVARRRP